MYSRALMGFADFSYKESARLEAVRHALVRVQWQRAGNHCTCHRMAVIPSGGPARKRCPCYATWPSTLHSANTSIAKSSGYNDLVMWDNRRTTHRACPFPWKKAPDMHRTNLRGERWTA